MNPETIIAARDRHYAACSQEPQHSGTFAPGHFIPANRARNHSEAGYRSLVAKLPALQRVLQAEELSDSSVLIGLNDHKLAEIIVQREDQCLVSLVLLDTNAISSAQQSGPQWFALQLAMVNRNGQSKFYEGITLAALVNGRTRGYDLAEHLAVLEHLDLHKRQINFGGEVHSFTGRTELLQLFPKAEQIGPAMRIPEEAFVAAAAAG